MKKTDYHIPLYNGSLYHIYNRGNGREKIFIVKKNYYYFLNQYKKYISNYADTFAYCLLPNHFHFLIRTKSNDPGILSENFRKLFISFTMSINKQEKRKGNLLQRGFRRKIIEDEKYFYSAIYYIHSNPVHHKIVDDLKKYEFNSYYSLVSNDKTFLCRDQVMEWFSGRQNFIDYHNQPNCKIYNDDFLIEDE